MQVDELTLAHQVEAMGLIIGEELAGGLDRDLTKMLQL